MSPPILRSMLISAATFHRLGVTTLNQYQCLLSIASKPGISAETLGNILGSRVSAVHGFCSKLVENDLVFIKMGYKSGRQFKVRLVQYYLTEKAESAMRMEAS